MNRLKRMFNRIMKVIKLEEMRILPGQLAFFIVFSLFTIFSLIGLIGSNFITHELLERISQTLPSGVSSVLASVLEGRTGDFNIIIFVIVSLYVASDGCMAMIITSNAIYKIKNNNIIKQKIKSILMIIILIILILFIILVPAFGELIINLLKKSYDNRFIETTYQIFMALKLPISFIIIFMGVKILYTIAPDSKLLSKYTNSGALFTTMGWIIVTKGYSIYLNNINTYNLYYGSLANIVILLFWVYLLAYIFTIGIALNYETLEESKKLSTQNEEK